MYLDIAGVILLALDKEGKVVLANPKACSVLGGEEGKLSVRIGSRASFRSTNVERFGESFSS